MIRSAQSQDAVKIAELMLEHPLWQSYGLSLETEVVRIEHLLAHKFCLVLEEHNSLNGFVIFDVWTFGSNGYIQLIGTKLGHTGQGIGEALIHQAHVVMSQTTNRSFLLCTGTNVRAHAFYQRLGYVKVGELPHWIKAGVHEVIFCNYDIGSKT